jgi:hypothetical protein
MELAPQAGFEPATLRLTEATLLRHQMAASVTKMMSANDLRADTGRHQPLSTILNDDGAPCF